jgi:hypothetical protein
VISTRIWRDHYNNDPTIVGKPIKFAEAATDRRVAPAERHASGGDFWFVVLSILAANHSFDGYVRLKPDTTLERAKTEMGTVMNGLAKDYPLFDLNRAYVVKPLVEQLVGDLGPILIVVLSATALLLILACVNVTNLMLARGAARAREMAVRVALGAGRGRLVRQLLTVDRSPPRARSADCPRQHRSARPACRGREKSATSGGRDLRQLGARLCATHPRDQRPHRRLRPGDSPRQHGPADADEREQPLGHGWTRDGAMARRTDDRGDRARRRARRRCRAG